MDLDPKLVSPKTHRPLRPLGSDELAALNAAIRAGTVRTVEGEPVDRELQGALAVEGEPVVYRVEDDIPVLLAAEGIAWDVRRPAG